MSIRALRPCLLVFFMTGLMLQPRDALAVGEVFKVDTSGTEYCGHFDFIKFSGKNDLDLWVRIDSATQFTISTTENFGFDTAFPVFGQTYEITRGKSAFVGGLLFDDGGYISIQGTAIYNKNTGAVTKLSGTFIQSEAFYYDCFSSGSFVTTKRVR